ncbi:UTP--glucose-1-phosphate uridylyltransferase [Alicyclobacillus vulcanalis]|uniref:UTP--glucose-1-phosphate uridylyltransferase n=1 Tax=Alicyclobacillus vulcanalis TaxID=252246 RepID=A0A1N7JX46_9BACL|nr:sugar phosphate nucleotidyltransferase [Alicyclobacillus vulcanalis]SIS53900.1 UTP--glucose-1-phosphate uridylyltransferase [Alicyclobacillus vulcanalis]
MDIGCAVIPAAGLGTRLRPATLWIPKEMFPVLDTPAIAFALEEAWACGVERIAVIVRPGKTMLVDFVQSWAKERQAQEGRAPEVAFVVQEQPLGLGDAVRRAKPQVGSEPFFVLLPDELFLGTPLALGSLLEGAPARFSAIVGTQKVPLEEVHLYGVVRVGEGCRVVELIEKPKPGEAPSNVAIVGRYAFQPSVFDALAETAPGANGEVQLTDALRLLVPEGVFARHLSAERFDIGSAAGWARAAESLSKMRAHEGVIATAKPPVAAACPAPRR